MSRRRFVLTATVTLGAFLAATFGNVLPANAVTGKCPAGFVRIANLDLKSSSGAKAPGKIQLYYNSSTKEKCALVQRTGNANGVAGKTSVTLQPKGKNAKSDSGNFEFYAGPVRLPASGCVTLSGKLAYKGVTYSYKKTNGWCSVKGVGSSAVSKSSSKVTKTETMATEKFTAKVVSPIAGMRGGNSFGQLGHGRTVPHRGIDFSTGCGKTVRAATDGTLRKKSGAGWAGTYLVTVTGANGVVTKYAHMQSFSVANGKKVKAGQKIGTVGARGNATGCHLHFEVSVKGKTVNPRPWLDKRI